MNILGTLFRLICSWLLLIVFAVYTTAPVHIAPVPFLEHIDVETLRPMFTTLNWVSIAALVLLVLALLRIQEMLWNVCFAAAFILCINFLACFIADPATILPSALENNRAVLDFCYLPRLYPIPAVLIIALFAMGWLCSTAPFRIMFTCILSCALWYGCTEVFHYMIGTWAKSPDPSLPELLHAAQTAPWISAAIPGAFFLVYSLLMAFIETFISRREDARKRRAAKAAEEAQQLEAESKEQPVEQPAEPVNEPTLPPIPELLPAEDAPKAEDKPADTPAEVAPKAEDKPADTPAEVAPKAEDKPADTPAEVAPKAEDKTADTPAEVAPKAEDKPADTPAEVAPKSEDKPADTPAEDAPKAEDKPADTAK